jgi:hypothetical protein
MMVRVMVRVRVRVTLISDGTGMTRIRGPFVMAISP